MNGKHLVLVTICAGIVTSLTDWFFAGDWLHRRWTYPEIWRQGVEAKAIAITSPLPFLTCGVFSYVTALLGLHAFGGTIGFAFAVWLIGPLPLILTNAAFMKLHRIFVASYLISWLVKLVIVAVTASWLLY